MTPPSAVDHATRVRATVLRVVVLVVLVGVALLWLQYRQSEADRAEQYARDSTAGAPAGFGERGIELASGPGREVVVMTDLSCPHCQDFFADRGDELQRLVDGGEHTVWLQVLDVRAGSDTNEVALGYLLDAAADPGVDALAAYRAVSRAVTGLDDEAATSRVERAIRDELSSVVADPPARAPRLTTEQQRWLSARTYENREDEGSVPAVTVDGESVDVDDLADAGL